MSMQTDAANRALGFSVVLEPDEADGGFVVHCPELKGCWSQGETAERHSTIFPTQSRLGWQSMWSKLSTFHADRQPENNSREA